MITIENVGDWVEVLLEGFVAFWNIALIKLPDGTEVGLWIVPVIILVLLGGIVAFRIVKKHRG